MTSPAPDAAPRIAILGSCVTRDAFDHEDARRFKLVSSVERTALGSFMGRRTQVLQPDYDKITSDAQRRTVQDDIAKQGRLRLRKLRFDALVVDLIDERLPVARFADGGTATVSSEFRQLSTPISQYTKVLPYTEQAFDRWRAGWTSLLDLLDQIGARHKVVVHRAHWVVRATDGRASVDDPETVYAANRWLNDAYEHMANTLEPHQAIEVPTRRVLADPQHPHGLAPFHYTPEYYAEILRQLDVFLERTR